MKTVESNLYPKISCLCVTHNKPKMLARAIQLFLSQSYPNKQLVIVFQESDTITSQFILNHSFNNNIKIVSVPVNTQRQTLGDLRNLSILSADGEYVCQWDDDDLYHSNRLALQYEFIIKNSIEACVLEQWTIYNMYTDKFYISNKRLWEGSLMCRTSVIKELSYPSLEKGEDTCLIDSLIEKNKIMALPNHPELYIYVYHGKNTWDEKHFNLIFSLSTELSGDSLDKAIKLKNNFTL